MLRYGNYTGPGWSAGLAQSSVISDLKPIDRLDAAAQKHDAQYAAGGDLLAADRLFIREAVLGPDEFFDDSMSPTALARTIGDGMSLLVHPERLFAVAAVRAQAEMRQLGLLPKKIPRAQLHTEQEDLLRRILTNQYSPERQTWLERNQPPPLPTANQPRHSSEPDEWTLVQTGQLAPRD
nr:hypothetical protein [Tolivirales sp.]